MVLLPPSLSPSSLSLSLSLSPPSPLLPLPFPLFPFPLSLSPPLSIALCNVRENSRKRQTESKASITTFHVADEGVESYLGSRTRGVPLASCNLSYNTTRLCDHIPMFTIHEFRNPDRLVGLVVKAPPRERKIPGSDPRLGRDFFRVESYR